MDILGMGVVHSPASTEESAEILVACARERQRVGFIGGETELSLGFPPSALDAVIRTRKMARVLEYAPSDMVTAVEAGVTLAEVQAVTRAERQMLALDAPHPDRATLGGLVATGAFGPRRARYGAVRDLIIGVTLIRADGIVARGGGKVVKNVAGFDLPKVVCGSLGTLGFVARATFRLHPLPDASGTVLFPRVSAEAVVSLVSRMRNAQLEPTSVVALATGTAFELGVRFEGFEKAVADQMKRVRELGETAESDAFWERHDAIRRTDRGRLRVQVATLPTRLPAMAARMAPILEALRDGSFAVYATLGAGFLTGEVLDAKAAIAALSAARAALAAEGGWLVVADAPAEVRAGIDPWGPAPGSFALMSELKHRFDPERRLNPGRFIGGL